MKDKEIYDTDVNLMYGVDDNPSLVKKVLFGIQGCRDFAHACAKSYLVTCPQASFRQQYTSKGMVS